MRIADLVDAFTDRVIYHDPTPEIPVPICKVLTKGGAVYDTVNTEDPRELAVACAALFDEAWRLATPEEFTVFYQAPDDRMMRLQWVKPLVIRPVLELIQGGKT